jgi:hypothetical protein
MDIFEIGLIQMIFVLFGCRPAMSPERRPPPEFLMPLPIRKTRAGLQFTCAAPTVTWNTQHLNDVWVCNSDGYVGQVKPFLFLM